MLCIGRDPDFMALHKQSTFNIVNGAHVVNNFPTFLRS